MTMLTKRLYATLPVPGVAPKDACGYEHALIWALEAEKLDLPRLSARCEHFTALHWEHVQKFALLIDCLSSPARRRVMTGMSHALQSVSKGTISCQACRKMRQRKGVWFMMDCEICAGVGHCGAITYPSVEDFMSWRTTRGVAS